MKTSSIRGELGIAEGFTSYYGPLAVRRAGITRDNEYLANLSRAIRELQTTPGRKVQSLAMSSYDTFIKFYRPDANSVNTAISYYTKGYVVAWLAGRAYSERHPRTQDTRRRDEGCA